MQIKTTKYHFKPIRTAYYQNKQTKNRKYQVLGITWRKWSPCALLVGMLNGAAAMKNKISIWSNNSTSEYILKRIGGRDSKRYLYPMFIAALFKSQKTQVSIQRWMDEQNVVYIYKRKKILARAISWMYLEEIMLSEISKSQKDKWYMILLVWGTWSSQI